MGRLLQPNALIAVTGSAKVPMLHPGVASSGILRPRGGGQRHRTRDGLGQRTQEGTPGHAPSVAIENNIAIENFILIQND